jgi:hypothetical protein
LQGGGQNNQFKSEEDEKKDDVDDSMEFIPDPNFLLKLNMNMAKNDEIMNNKKTPNNGNNNNNIKDPHQRLIRTNDEFYQPNEADQ